MGWWPDGSICLGVDVVGEQKTVEWVADVDWVVPVVDAEN